MFMCQNSESHTPFCLQRYAWLSCFKFKRTRTDFRISRQYQAFCIDPRITTLDGVPPSSSTLGLDQPGYTIQSLCQRGMLNEALDALIAVDHHGTVPSVDMYRNLLKLCTKKRALTQAKQVHAYLVKHRMESTRFLGECLVKTYVQCGSLDDALRVFYRLSERTIVAWTAVISGYGKAGRDHEVLRMFRSMQLEGLQPNKYTLIAIIRACGNMGDLETGKLIHAEAVKCRCESDVIVGTCLIDMYSKCRTMAAAQTVFDGLSLRDVVSWAAMLVAWVRTNQSEKSLRMYIEFQNEGISPDAWIFVSALQACGLLAEKEGNVLAATEDLFEYFQMGRVIHAEAWRNGYRSDVFVGSTLVSMYTKCGSIVDARYVFDMLRHRNVVMWNAMLGAYAQQEFGEEALNLYGLLLSEGVTPDARTFVSAIQACGSLAQKEDNVCADPQPDGFEGLHVGKAIHAEAWRTGYSSDVFVNNSLVSMYGKCGSIMDARQVFDDMPHNDAVAWNAMLGACVQEGHLEQALQLFGQLLEEGVTPDDTTFVSTIQCSGLLAQKEQDFLVNGQSVKLNTLHKVKSLHALVSSAGPEKDIYVSNVLISTYGKCRSILDAQSVFDGLSHRDVVSWNALLAAYDQEGQPMEALALFDRMQGEGAAPDDITIVYVLKACGNTGNLDVCVELHHLLDGKGKHLNLFVANTLIYAYGKCACMVPARRVFDRVSQPNVVSWNALIAGYARQGDYASTVLCYEEMQGLGANPDGVTFLSLLYACSHAGMVDKGIQYFETMSRRFNISPTSQHFASMVDLLGRAGYFTMVEDLLSRMPVRPDQSFWLCLLGVCRMHGNIALGKYAFEHAVHLHPMHPAPYVLMWNMYAHAGMWDSANQVNNLRQNAGAWRKPGQCWIKHEEDGGTFTVGHHVHDEYGHLHEFLDKLGNEVDGVMNGC